MRARSRSPRRGVSCADGCISRIRTGVAVGIGTVVLLLAPQVRGDDLADEADLHFKLATERYQAKDFRGALEHYLLSNRLVPNRNVVFNVARTYEQLGELPNAFRYFSQALEGEADAATRQRIEAAIHRISQSVAILRVESDPPGATLYVDRRDLGPRGLTPRKLAFPAGVYTILAELPGYEPAQIARVEARVGTEAPVTIKLTRIVGTLQIAGAGEAVRVDSEKNDPTCVAPCELPLAPGRHTVFFSREGFQVAREEVDVTAKTSLAMRPRMVPLTGSVVVGADERGALIEVDGRAVGFTPTVAVLPVGERRIRVSLLGYRSVERKVTVRAAEEVRVDVELRPLDEVSAASRSTESVDSAPASVSIVPSHELRGMAYPTLVEALRGVRGVHVGDDTTYPSLGFRGFSRPGDYGNRVLVLVDGHPTNDNFIGSSFVGYDARTDLEDVERIEVVRGPGSVLYGTGAFSGVVNVVTRGRGSREGVRAGTSTNQYGVARGHVGATVKLGDDAGLWVSAAGARSGEGRDYAFPTLAGAGFDGTVRGLDGFRAGTLAGRVWWRAFTLQWFLHSRAKRAPAAPYATLVNNPGTSLVDTRELFEARFEPKVTDSFRLLLRAYLNRAAYQGTYAYAAQDGGTGREDFQGTWTGLEARGEIALARSLRVTVGAEGQYHFQAKLLGRNQATTYLDENRPFQVGAAYAVADVTPSDRVKISVGERLDAYSTFGASQNPRVAVIVKPYEQGTLKLLAGKAFRAPSIYELTYNDGGFTQVRPKEKGIALSPETIYSGEVELTHRLTSNVSLLGSVYASYVRDLIVLRGETTLADPAFYDNSPSPILVLGAETELRREWKQGFSAALAYAYQRPRYTSSNDLRSVPNAPEHLASIKGAAPILGRELGLFTRLSVEGPRFDRFDRAADEPQSSTKGAAVWDLVFSGVIQRDRLRYAYAAGVYNAFDWRYAVPVSGEFRQRTIVQNGRTLLLSAMVEY